MLDSAGPARIRLRGYVLRVARHRPHLGSAVAELADIRDCTVAEIVDQLT